MSGVPNCRVFLDNAEQRIRALADAVFRESFPARPPTFDDGYMHGLYRAAEELRAIFDELPQDAP